MWPACNANPNWRRLLAAKHTVERRWELGPSEGESDPESCLWIHDLLATVIQRARSTTIIALSEVCHKPMHLDDFAGLDDLSSAYCHDPDMNMQRLEKACPFIPGIVAEGVPNPCHSRYRMLDGRHRICRLKLAVPNATHAHFFVLNHQEALQHLSRDCDKQHEPPSSIISSESLETVWQDGNTQLESPSIATFVQHSRPQVDKHCSSWCAECTSSSVLSNGRSAQVVRKVGGAHLNMEL